MSHIASREQQQAFKALERAFNKCKQKGLVIYAKQYNLVAYTKEADLYAEQFDFERVAIAGTGTQIPCLCIKRILADSGADDYAKYQSKSDEMLHEPS